MEQTKQDLDAMQEKLEEKSDNNAKQQAKQGQAKQLMINYLEEHGFQDYLPKLDETGIIMQPVPNNESAFFVDLTVTDSPIPMRVITTINEAKESQVKIYYVGYDYSMFEGNTKLFFKRCEKEFKKILKKAKRNALKQRKADELASHVEHKKNMLMKAELEKHDDPKGEKLQRERNAYRDSIKTDRCKI